MKLALKFSGQWVPEASRLYLNGLSRPYNLEDLEEMCRMQLVMEAYAMQIPSGRHVFCDTEAVNFLIWSRLKFGKTCPLILDAVRRSRYDLFLLMRPDIPWEPDPLRENPEDRDLLRVLWLETLQSFGIPWIEISGNLRETEAEMLVSKYCP